MFFLQVTKEIASGTSAVWGTFVMVSSVLFVVFFSFYYQRRIVRINGNILRLEKEKQANLVKASIQFQEDERNRIAADLHDDAGPLLATVRLYLNEGMVNKDKPAQLQAIHNARQIVDDTITLIRNISHSLLSPTLKNFGLESGVVNLYEKINGSGKIAATARFNEYEVRLSAEKELLCFRVIQELVNNIIKHSYANFIHLIQNKADDNILIIIQHDGKGLVQSEFNKLVLESDGLGLKNIENRMQVLGGRITFEKGRDDGLFKVTLEVPMGDKKIGS